MAAQFTATKGPSRATTPRGGCALAKTSLPVPLSPVMSTVASESGDALDQVVDLAHRRALADERSQGAVQVRREALHSSRERARLRGAVDRDGEDVELHRLAR